MCSLWSFQWGLVWSRELPGCDTCVSAAIPPACWIWPSSSDGKRWDQLLGKGCIARASHFHFKVNLLRSPWIYSPLLPPSEGQRKSGYHTCVFLFITRADSVAQLGGPSSQSFSLLLIKDAPREECCLIQSMQFTEGLQVATELSKGRAGCGYHGTEENMTQSLPLRFLSASNKVISAHREICSMACELLPTRYLSQSWRAVSAWQGVGQPWGASWGGGFWAGS